MFTRVLFIITRGWGGGGVRYSTKFNQGRLRPEVIFRRKGVTPVVYLLLTNGKPFTYLVQTFTSLLTLTADIFHSHKMDRLALLGLFTNRSDRFPVPFHILQLVKPRVESVTFHIPEP